VPRRASRPLTSFESAAAFREWLEAFHAAAGNGAPSVAATELFVRCRKVGARGKGITYAEALDEALCFGWIDGVRRGIDDDSFSVRFTPRRPGSFWSSVNLRHARRLEAAGLMRPPGLAAFRASASAKETGYSYESRPVTLAPDLEARLRANDGAWAFWESRPPGYRRTSAFWVMSAKRDETRARRLEVLIATCARGERIPLLKPAAKKGS